MFPEFFGIHALTKVIIFVSVVILSCLANSDRILLDLLGKKVIPP